MLHKTDVNGPTAAPPEPGGSCRCLQVPAPDDLRPQRRAPEEDQGGQKNRAEANAYHRGVDHPQCAAQQGDQGEKAGKHAQAQIETDLPMPD